jgi:hypothetical protein
VKAVRRPLLAVLVLAGVFAVLAAGCGGTGETLVAAPVSAQTLSESAKSSAAEESARFSFAMTMTAPGLGQELGFTGEGAFDKAADRSSMSFDMSSFAQLLGSGLGALGGSSGAPDLGDPDGWKIEVMQDGQIVYMRFPLIEERLPDGKSWVKIDAAQAARMQGFDLEQLKQIGSNDPRSLLQFLEAVAGQIETVGPEEVRGVPTTHYRATIDLRRYADLFPPEQREQAASIFDSLLAQTGLSTMPVDIWLDEKERVLKAELRMSAAQPGTANGFDATMSVELYDYGEPVDLDLPSADEVIDAADVAALGG